jgi:hypothetical protein
VTLGGFAHRLHDIHALERLLDEVVRAFAHGFHGSLDRAVGGHHHHFGVRRHRVQRLDQIEAAHAGQHQVGQHHIYALLATQLEPDARVFGEQRAKAFALKDPLERGQIRALILDD